MTSDPNNESATLLARWQRDGDPEALDALLRAEVRILRDRLRRASAGPRGSVSASDVAQEAVLNLLRVRVAPRFDDPRALRSYLWRAAVRLLGARLRGRRGMIAHIDPKSSQVFASAIKTTGGVGAAERRDLQAGLTLAVSLLAPDDQAILSLVYFEGLNAEQASTRLNITHEAARKRLARARARLAEKLGDWSELIG